jgi:nucleoside-diphosphate-sugar epimerase
MAEGDLVPRLFCFGLGYSAEALARRLQPQGWEIAGTTRDKARLIELARQDFDMVHFDGQGSGALSAALSDSTHLLHSVPPKDGVDPVLGACRDLLSSLPALTWVGYLSTVGVYGDRDGGWVDEESPPAPLSERTKARVAAEADWLAFGEAMNVPVQIFRLSGIYGPGRSAFDKLDDPGARRIIKPGQVFNRVHVDDIASVLEASIARPRAGAVYNVADDESAPPEAVVEYAAELMGVEPPPAVPFEDADLSPMARSFYSENRRIRNDRIKSELGVDLRFPTYRDGLRAILASAQR